MADLSITAANFKKGTGAKTKFGVAGGTITAGMPVYMDASDGDKLKACDANAAFNTSVAVGIATHSASADQTLEYQYAGKCNIGGTVVAGIPYGVSATAGGIALYGNAGPASDIVSGMYPCLVGFGLLATSGGATDNFLVAIVPSRVVVA